MNLQQVPEGKAADPAPARPQFRINTGAALDRMAEEQASA